MSKKAVLFCGKTEDVLIKQIITHLKDEYNFYVELHNPNMFSLALSEYNQFINKFDLVVGKVNGLSTLDVLHSAKINYIPAINQFDSVYNCTNRICLDNILRKVFSKYERVLNNYFLPKSWLHPSPLKNINKFNQWASTKLPLVFKSHLQHNDFFRFNFLARKPEEIGDFVVNYKDALYFDLYIQEFIECDGFDRKIYVVGDKIFGIKRENPIYIYLRDKPESIDVEMIKREPFELSENIKQLAQILSKELNLDIFGFDLVKPIKREGYVLLDLNDFPGFKGIDNIDKVIANYIIDYLERV
ncbi:MAG: hypothetical protein EU541_08610 [Promethearchaeota archaeon]|nr:MAG: hypothetical protein EU541_08610 [Candidatus Lokiarchaeota archaeon]